MRLQVSLERAYRELAAKGWNADQRRWDLQEVTGASLEVCSNVINPEFITDLHEAKDSLAT